jgi:hypothetical protein
MLAPAFFVSRAGRYVVAIIRPAAERPADELAAVEIGPLPQSAVALLARLALDAEARREVWHAPLRIRVG